jgi:hypothetical protein
MKKLSKLLIPVSMVLVLAVIPTASASINRYWPVFTNPNFSNGCQGWNLSATSGSSATCVNAYNSWVSSTKVVVGQRSAQNPALAYDPAIGKFIMSWVGINCCSFNINMISSSDMTNWNNQVTLSIGASSAAGCLDPEVIDSTYDPDNGKVYIAYLHVDVTIGGCNANQVYVFSTSDGTTASSISLVTSTITCSPTCGGDNQMSGPSITYDTVNHRFVVANMRNQAITTCDPTGHCSTSELHNLLTYTSTDGVNWAGGQMVNVSPVSTNVRPDIAYLNGNYYLSYIDGAGSFGIHILRSPDLNTWTVISNPNQQSYQTPEISYNPSESKYHLDWKGTNSQINDALSSDAINWSPPSVFETTQNEPSVDYNPTSQTMLLAWAGTDCCIGGTLNVEQYDHFSTSTTAFQSYSTCNGCGYAGSFASQSSSAPFSSNYLQRQCISSDCSSFTETGYSYTFSVGFSLTQFAQIGPSGSWFNYGLSLYVSWSGPVGPCGFSTMQLILDLKDNGGVNIYNCDNTRHLYFVEVAIDQSNGSPTLAAQSYGVTMNVYNALSHWGLPDGSITTGGVESQTNGYQLTVVYGQAQLGVNYTNACFGSACSPQACRPNPCPLVADAKANK